MATKGIKAFEDALKADEGLKQRYGEALEAIAGAGKATSDGEAMQMAAAELGFEIPLEELEQAWASLQELDDSELESVVGGNRQTLEDEYGHDFFCYGIWHCAIVSMHTECKDISVACWSDWKCAIVNNEPVCIFNEL